MDRRGRGDQSHLTLCSGKGKESSRLLLRDSGFGGRRGSLGLRDSAAWRFPGSAALPRARFSPPASELPGRSHLAVTPAGSRASHDPTSGGPPPAVVPGPRAQTLATHPGHSALAVRGETGLVRLGHCGHWLAAGQSSGVYPGARQRPSLKAGRRRPRKGGAVPGSARCLVRSPFFLSYFPQAVRLRSWKLGRVDPTRTPRF